MKLRGKVALVTGGTSGIGKAICHLFSSEGAMVVVGGRNEAHGVDVVAEIKSSGGKATFEKIDVVNSSSVAKVVEKVINDHLKIDVLVNNAGVVRLSRIVDFEEEEWDLVYDTNVKGTYLCSKAVLSHMMNRRSGCIINVSSAAGLRPIARMGGYSSSKAAVISLTKVLALECAEYQIRVNCICPGSVETPMAEYVALSQGLDFAEVKEAVKGKIPLGRMGNPGEIAASALFLASDSSSYITGEVLVVDGGSLAGLRAPLASTQV